MNLKEIIKLIFLRKKNITYSASFFILISILYITFTDELYDSRATVLPISSSGSALDSIGGGIGGLFDLNLGSSQSTAFNPDIYPAILTSKKLSDILLRKKFSFEGDYTDLFSILSNDKSFDNELKKEIFFDKLSKKLRTEILQVSHNQFTDLIKINVESLSPGLSQSILKAAIEETEIINNEIFGQKESEKLSFLTLRIVEVEQEVNHIEDKFVEFKETNRGGINSPALLMMEQQILRELDIKKNVLISLNQQYELLKIQSQDNTLVLYMIDPPNFPTKKSHPQTLLLLLASILLGSVVGFVISPIVNKYKS
tara:strand:- start:12741 stop:13679 length:939 start_codon:yes stop_codon:yes gene_type:complete